MIATSGFLTALECTKFVFGRDSAPGSLQRSPRPPSWFKGVLLLREGRRGEGRGGEGREREEGGEGRAVSLAKLVLALGPSPRPWLRQQDIAVVLAINFHSGVDKHIYHISYHIKLSYTPYVATITNRNIGLTAMMC